LSGEQQAAIQGAIQHFSDIERKVERALANRTSPTNVAVLNDIVSAQTDRITEILATIRQEIGRTEYDVTETGHLADEAS